MRQILILIWFLITSTQTYASTCEASLQASQQSVVVRQIQQLNPNILGGAKISDDWSSVYILLKTEEQKYAAGGLFDPDLKNYILQNQSKHYEFKNFTDRDFKQFYINALRSLYVRAANFWMTAEVTQLAGRQLHPDILKIASRILEGTSSPWTLKDRELTSEAAALYFNERKWERLPWAQLLSFVEAWKKVSPYSFSYDEFSKFWSANAEKFGLDFSLFSRVQSALSGHEKSLFCCLSDPGCMNCPHNRLWLKTNP